MGGAAPLLRVAVADEERDEFELFARALAAAMVS